MIIDLNPTATVGKCAGLFLYSLWRGELSEPPLPGGVSERSLGVAELRPPFLLGRAPFPFRILCFQSEAKQIERELHAPSTCQNKTSWKMLTCRWAFD